MYEKVAIFCRVVQLLLICESDKKQTPGHDKVRSLLRDAKFNRRD